MFAERIREARRRSGLSQKELGAMLGVSATAVHKWEHGQSEPDIETTARLARLFHMSLDELCGQDAPEENERNMTVMTRAFRQLTPEEQRKLLAVGRALFRHAFPEEDGE